MTPSDSSRRNSLIALGTTAVIAVYTAGFVKTRAAAAHFADQDAERRRPPPTVHPEVPVAATATSAAPRPELPPAPVAEKPKPSSAQKASAPPPSKPAAAPDSTAVVTQKPAADTVMPAPAVTTQVATPPVAPPAPPRDTTPTPVAATTPAKDTVAKQPEKEVWKDGLYFGWGRSRHGDIQAGVEIKGGKIASAFISECLTQYSCSWISQLPPQVVARQSADVDYVTGATQSANAFYYAVVDALKKAK